jgi:hypothetical protein
VRLQQPIDTPYGPYTDQFGPEQHKFGPLEPIRAKVRELAARSRTEKRSPVNYLTYSIYVKLT